MKKKTRKSDRWHSYDCKLPMALLDGCILYLCQRSFYSRAKISEYEYFHMTAVVTAIELFTNTNPGYGLASRSSILAGCTSRPHLACFPEHQTQD